MAHSIWTVPTFTRVRNEKAIDIDVYSDATQGDERTRAALDDALHRLATGRKGLEINSRPLDGSRELQYMKVEVDRKPGIVVYFEQKTDSLVLWGVEKLRPGRTESDTSLDIWNRALTDHSVPAHHVLFTSRDKLRFWDGPKAELVDAWPNDPQFVVVDDTAAFDKPVEVDELPRTGRVLPDGAVAALERWHASAERLRVAETYRRMSDDWGRLPDKADIDDMIAVRRRELDESHGSHPAYAAAGPALDAIAEDGKAAASTVVTSRQSVLERVEDRCHEDRRRENGDLVEFSRLAGDWMAQAGQMRFGADFEGRLDQLRPLAGVTGRLVGSDTPLVEVPRNYPGLTSGHGL
jgi:hypothetical protein